MHLKRVGEYCQESLDDAVDMSTCWAMVHRPIRPKAKIPRQIVGFSLPPALALAVKTEAARRGLSLRKLFEEMWALYQKTGQQNGRPCP